MKRAYQAAVAEAGLAAFGPGDQVVDLAGAWSPVAARESASPVPPGHRTPQMGRDHVGGPADVERQTDGRGRPGECAGPQLPDQAGRAGEQLCGLGDDKLPGRTQCTAGGVAAPAAVWLAAPDVAARACVAQAAQAAQVAAGQLVEQVVVDAAGDHRRD